MTLGIRLMDSGRLTRDLKSLVFVVNLIDLDRGHTMWQLTFANYSHVLTNRNDEWIVHRISWTQGVVRNTAL